MEDLLAHLQRAADGDLEPAVYLSAIPAGTGKTQTLTAFARTLMTHPQYADTGMLIACNQVSEVADIARDLAAHRDHLHIRVGSDNRETLALGAHDSAAQAQVVISTQEALRRILRDVSDFAAAGALHYQGRRRAVLAWDEAISFHSPVLLDAGQLGALSDVVARQGAMSAVSALDGWKVQLRAAMPGQLDVPDFGALGLDFTRLEQDAATDDEATQVRALRRLSGGRGYVMADNQRGRLLVTHVPELPRSLLPVIVTDASAAEGVNRERYRQMAQGQAVQWLKDAGKTYANMMIRLVNNAASRSIYESQETERGRDLIEMATRYIREVPEDETVLVISYKKRMRMKGVPERTIAAAIDASLTFQERARVRHLTWGQHRATNDFRTVKRVLLMGLPFHSPAVAHATSAATLGRHMRSEEPDEHPTRDQVTAIANGMLRDAVLQAILRGHARKSLDGDCGHMEVVIPQIAKSGLSEVAYAEMFPGVSIVQDRVLMPSKPLTGLAKELAAAIQRRFDDGQNDIPHPVLRRDIKMAHRQNYQKLIHQPAFVDWLDARGLASRRLYGRITGIRRVT